MRRKTILVFVLGILVTYWLWTHAKSEDADRATYNYKDTDTERVKLEDKQQHPVDKKPRRKEQPVKIAKSGQKVPPLSLHVINGVKRFVFFVGYGGSGHSIIGSLMDAHPHVVMPHQFLLFYKFSELDESPDSSWKENLFRQLYLKSSSDTTRSRTRSNKGYTLGVDTDGSWQGTFDRYIDVIGDKSGGITTSCYEKEKENFLENYHKLKRILPMPIIVIHAVRNPFDMISSRLAFNTKLISKDKANYRRNEFAKIHKSETVQNQSKVEEKFDKINFPDQLKGTIEVMFHHFDSVVEMIDEVFVTDTVLEVHNCDLVADPGKTMSQIFEALQVETSEEYLEMCSNKVYKSVSRTRDLVAWPPELREMVEEKMKDYKMFQKYNFTSD